MASRSIDEGQQALDAIRVRSTTALHERRVAFDERLAELESKAAKNLTSVFGSWQAINWRTLRSAVQRNGVWFSSSLHREFDLNRDLARAYLNLVLLIWDEFFGAQLSGLMAIFFTEGSKSRRIPRWRLSCFLLVG